MKLDNVTFSNDTTKNFVHEVQIHHGAMVTVLTLIARMRGPDKDKKLSNELSELRAAVSRSRDWALHQLMSRMEGTSDGLKLDEAGCKAARDFLRTQRRYMGEEVVAHAVRVGVIGSGEYNPAAPKEDNASAESAAA